MSRYTRRCDGCGAEVAARESTGKVLCVGCHPADLPFTFEEGARRTMDDLVEFLRARFDEDEQAARRAASLCGCHTDAPSWIFGDESTDGRILVADDPHPQVKRKLNRRWSSTYDGLFMAQHIVRHDPARVLREVDAKRTLLGVWSRASTDDRRAAYSLRNLALPYADHQDYRPEWRP